MSAPTVLVVDDDPNIRTVLRKYLEADAMRVVEASDGAAALAIVDGVDLVLLDVAMPDLSGTDVLREIRRRSTVPVILVTARTDELDVVVGLNVGADDYVSKPFRPRELVARVQALLRRSTRTSPPTDAPANGFLLDPARREVWRDGTLCALTAKEFDLLAVLAREPGRVFTRRQMLDAAWGYDHVGDDRIIDVHVRKLRKALGDPADSPALIETVRGVGYRFAAARPPDR